MFCDTAWGLDNGTSRCISLDMAGILRGDGCRILLLITGVTVGGNDDVSCIISAGGGRLVDVCWDSCG